MPNSLKCRLKNLVRNGLLRERDLKRIIIIPEGATNGEVFKKTYPNVSIEYREANEFVEDHVCVCFMDCLTTIYYPAWWWNAPYEIDQEVKT